MLLKLFHLSVAAVNAYTLWYDYNYVHMAFPKKELIEYPFRGRSVFLTLWTLVLQTFYFAVALLNDIAGTNAAVPRKSSFFRTFKDTLFSLAFPMALYVSLAFWGIYFVDKDLIFPEHVAKVIPVWVNHIMHTTITPFIVIELIFNSKIYPRRKYGAGLVGVVMVGYILWINIIYFKSNVWMYPILQEQNWLQRILFFTASSGVALLLYFVGEKLNSLFWCEQEAKNTKTKSKKKSR